MCSYKVQMCSPGLQPHRQVGREGQDSSEFLPLREKGGFRHRMGLEHQGPVGNGIPFSPSTRLHPPLSSMNKTFKIFDTRRATWCMACVAGNY